MAYRTLTLAALLATGVLAACGQERAPGSTTGARVVVVRVDPDGRGARAPVVRELRCRRDAASSGCRALARAARSTWSPVPRDAVCTQLYGGPQTARVTGEVGGRRVDARFTRRNGCEIARWERLAALLDPLVRSG